MSCANGKVYTQNTEMLEAKDLVEIITSKRIRLTRILEGDDIGKKDMNGVCLKAVLELPNQTVANRASRTHLNLSVL